MLDEYVNDLKTIIGERRATALKTMVYASGGEIAKGMVQAFDHVLSDVDDVLETYRTPEDVPEALQIEQPRRAAGRR